MRQKMYFLHMGAKKEKENHALVHNLLHKRNNLKIHLRRHAFPICKRPLRMITTRARGGAGDSERGYELQYLYVALLFVPGRRMAASRFNPLHGGGVSN